MTVEMCWECKLEDSDYEAKNLMEGCEPNISCTSKAMSGAAHVLKQHTHYHHTSTYVMVHVKHFMKMTVGPLMPHSYHACVYPCEHLSTTAFDACSKAALNDHTSTKVHAKIRLLMQLDASQ